MQFIVQAGGRGSRLRHLTWNKPKCLVSVNNKPVIYQLFESFPKAEFIIIGDYKFDVLENYLKICPPIVKYRLVKADKKGTCSGIKQALKYINGSFYLIWGDTTAYYLPNVSDTTVYTTSSFSCRWSVQDGVLKEITSSETGVPGLFYFPSPAVLKDIPEEGEFVKWLSQSGITYNTRPIVGMSEFGEYENVRSSNNFFCRPFNKVEVTTNTVQKRAVIPEYEHLIKKEQDWYEEVIKLGYKTKHKIISKDPYVMNFIPGSHPFDIPKLRSREKKTLIFNYLNELTSLHNLSHISVDEEEVYKVYVRKTIERVKSVCQVIPNFSYKTLTINGRKVKNVFQCSEEYWLNILQQVKPEKFTPIHGDPHFSNALVDDKFQITFIDPRGYFSKEGVWGDPYYDYAKVYYSAVGNFDQFNRRDFKVLVDEDVVEVMLEESKFKEQALEVFRDYFKDIRRIEILHGLIWLAFSGYVKDDIDSILGSFYLGLYWLDRGLNDTV